MRQISLWHIIFPIVAVCFSSCRVGSSIQLMVNCKLECKTSLPDSMKFISVVSGSAFHYYEYPQNYTQKSLRLYWDEYSKTLDDYGDSVRWTSPDSSFVMLKYFDAFNYVYPLDSFGDIDCEKFDTVRIREVIDERFEKAGKSAFSEYPDATIENICRNGNSLTLCAKSSEKRLLSKIIVASIEGGMHDFVVLRIEYPLKKSEKFDAIAVECMNYFAGE